MEANWNPLSIEISSRPEVMVTGGIDFLNVDTLRFAVEAALRSYSGDIGLSFSDAAFLDARSIRVLLECQRMVNDMGRSIAINDASRQILRALQFSGHAMSFNLPVLRIESALPAPERQTFRTIEWDILESVALGEPDLIISLRDTAVEAAEKAGMNEEEAGDVKLAVGEALVNALFHGCPNGRENRIRFRCLICSRGMVVEICDEGGGFDFEGKLAAALKDPPYTGIGLRIISQAMSEVGCTPCENGSRLRMIKWICQ